MIQCIAFNVYQPWALETLSAHGNPPIDLCIEIPNPGLRGFQRYTTRKNQEPLVKPDKGREWRKNIALKNETNNVEGNSWMHSRRDARAYERERNEKKKKTRKERAPMNRLNSLVTHPRFWWPLPNLILLTPMQQHLIPVRRQVALMSLRPIIRGGVSEYRPRMVEGRADDRTGH